MKIRDRILESVKKYIDSQGEEKFTPGETYIRTSGAAWDSNDVAALVDIALDRWYVGNTHTHEFERLFATAVKQRDVSLCNSGSSANLLALTALTSKQVKNRLRPGDEVITVAAGFPTTVNPIVQNGLVPVFVDINLPQYNALPHAISEAITDKTKAVFIAHTLGNPYKSRDIRDLCDQNDLWLISDCCDALGAEIHGQPVSYWADISTYSFFPAHQISMGEGGAVATNNPALGKVIRSFRDWGRDCWCMPGKDNTCGKRFEWCLGDLPQGFDHKYIYSEIGYNLKATDLQAALGIGQIKRLPVFVDRRNQNWRFYREYLDDFREFLVMPEPTSYSKPSWFGFTITVKDSAPFTRKDLVTFLEEHKVGTRMLFAGNLTKHPAYKEVNYKVSGTLHKTDRVMENSFWIGVFPGINSDMQNYTVEIFHEFMKKYGK